MGKNNSATPSASSGKRHPGFAPIRRGLLEHWLEMSGNAKVLYIWLHLKAYWFGPKRGCVEVSFDDMARGNGWSLKTVQRTIEELEAKPFIKVERATNQYKLTSVRILNYDREESTSAVDKSDQSGAVGVDCAVDKFDRTTDRSKPANQLSKQDLRVHKKVKEIKKGNRDAVRRPFDAERPIASKPFSLKEKRQNLNKNIAARIREDGDLYSDHAADAPFGKTEHEAFAATGYKPDLDSQLLSIEFVDATVYIYSENRSKGISPGNLCSKIIDYCGSERKKFGSGFYYPPDFVEHRNLLRAQERAQEKPRSVGVSA